MEKYYDLLGVGTKASVAEIRRAYASKLRSTRPDEDPVAFQALVEARDALLSSATKAERLPAGYEAPPAEKAGTPQALEEKQKPDLPEEANATTAQDSDEPTEIRSTSVWRSLLSDTAAALHKGLVADSMLDTTELELRFLALAAGEPAQIEYDLLCECYEVVAASQEHFSSQARSLGGAQRLFVFLVDFFEWDKRSRLIANVLDEDAGYLFMQFVAVAKGQRAPIRRTPPITKKPFNWQLVLFAWIIIGIFIRPLVNFVTTPVDPPSSLARETLFVPGHPTPVLLQRKFKVDASSLRGILQADIQNNKPVEWHEINYRVKTIYRDTSLYIKLLEEMRLYSELKRYSEEWDRETADLRWNHFGWANAEGCVRKGKMPQSIFMTNDPNFAYRSRLTAPFYLSAKTKVDEDDFAFERLKIYNLLLELADHFPEALPVIVATLEKKFAGTAFAKEVGRIQACSTAPATTR